MPTRPVRFGGEHRDGVFHFELSGGHAALDFANTLDERSRLPIERLTRFSDVVEWGRQAGLLDLDAVRAFSEFARQSPAKGDDALARAVALRETIFRLFNPLAHGEAPPREVLADLNRWQRAAAEQAPLVAVQGGLGWGRPDGTRGPLQILWPIVRSAVALATDTAALERLRCCQGEGCEWLFLDASRRQNRRWCDMSVCGNRAKVRTFRRNGSASNPEASLKDSDVPSQG